MKRLAYLPPSTWAAFVVLTMAFTYHGVDGTNNPIDQIRVMISDTNPLTPVFQDSELLGVLGINQQVFQSAQFYSGSGGANLPASPSNLLRTAAMLLRSMSIDNAKLAVIKQLLDVRMDATDTAEHLRQMAKDYLDYDDNSGAFFIIEQVNDAFSFRDRFWKTVQRNSAV